MSTVLDDIVSHITANTSGLTIRAGFIPDTPDTVITVMEPDPGLASLDTLGASVGVIKIERPILQIRSRAGQDDYETARVNAETVYKVLHNLVNTTIDSTRYLIIEALQPPFNLGRDQNGRWASGFNIQIHKEPNA